MNAKIIAFSGAHGTGKTTGVNHLANFFRETCDQKLKIGIIHEMARLCPLPVLSNQCSKVQEDAQLWIYSAQLKAEIEACARYDIVISDRTIVDCIAYTRFLGYYSMALAMESLATLALRRYRQIVFHRIEHYDYLVDDGFRNLDKESRVRIERILLETYRRMRMPMVDGASNITFPREWLRPETIDMFDALGDFA
jgi:thymidylate kinase